MKLRELAQRLLHVVTGSSFNRNLHHFFFYVGFLLNTFALNYTNILWFPGKQTTVLSQALPLSNMSFLVLQHTRHNEIYNNPAELSINQC